MKGCTDQDGSISKIKFPRFDRKQAYFVKLKNSVFSHSAINSALGCKEVFLESTIVSSGLITCFFNSLFCSDP